MKKYVIPLLEKKLEIVNFVLKDKEWGQNMDYFENMTSRELRLIEKKELENVLKILINTKI
jgi:hypothetical protein